MGWDRDHLELFQHSNWDFQVETALRQKESFCLNSAGISDFTDWQIQYISLHEYNIVTEISIFQHEIHVNI